MAADHDLRTLMHRRDTASAARRALEARARALNEQAAQLRLQAMHLAAAEDRAARGIAELSGRELQRGRGDAR